LYSQEIKEQYNSRYKVNWARWNDKEIELEILYNKLFPKVKDGIIWKYTDEEVMKVIAELNKSYYE
jgi:hypothetical protein